MVYLFLLLVILHIVSATCTNTDFTNNTYTYHYTNIINVTDTYQFNININENNSCLQLGKISYNFIIKNDYENVASFDFFKFCFGLCNGTIMYNLDAIQNFKFIYGVSVPGLTYIEQNINFTFYIANDIPDVIPKPEKTNLILYIALCIPFGGAIVLFVIPTVLLLICQHYEQKDDSQQADIQL
jgi:hypothetical protein